MDIGELARRNARRCPGKVCLVENNKRYTTEAFNYRVNQLANGLSEFGISRGDRAAILLPNCSEYVEIYIALAKIGAIAVPLNTRLNAREYVRYFQITKPKVLFTGGQLQDVAAEIRPALDTVQQVICIGTKTQKGEVSYEDLLSDSSVSEPPVEVNENDVAIIFFTSGTTGLPKGAMWTHRNVLEHLANLQMDLPYSRDDRGLVVLPMFHGPVTVALVHQLLYIGGCLVISPHSHLDAGQSFDTIKQENITCSCIVPTMMVQLVQYPGIEAYQNTIRQLRQIKYAASAASARVLGRAVELFGPIFTQGYGLTESVGGVSYLSKEDHIGIPEGSRRLSSCGKEYINVYIKIADENGTEVPPGTVGEVLVKSDKIFAGYWEMPEESQQVLKDGWLHTSDLGMFDGERYLYLVDRKKDMIISGGENIYPAEIEEVINGYAKVEESAVVGVADPTWGELVKAVVVVKDGEIATAEEIINFCRENLASYKKPKLVQFIDKLPRNSMGKVLKHLLKEQYFEKENEKQASGS